MNHFAHVAVALITLALGACAEGPDKPWSLRASLADAIAPDGYQTNSGQPHPTMQQAPAMMGSYAPGGASQVTIIGGQIKTPTGGMFSGNADWRPHAGVETILVAECQSTPIQLQRTDKTGAGLTMFATRINGIIYIGPYSTQGCAIPGNAQSFPGYGHFPLTIHDRIQGASVRIDAMNGAPQAVYPG